MGRPVEKKPGYDQAARRAARRVAFGGPLIWLGVLLSGISLFSLIQRELGLSLPRYPAFLVAYYRDIAYPIIEWPLPALHITLPERAKDLVSLYLLLGGLIRRPMGIIFDQAKETDYGAAFFAYPIPVVGEKLDELFRWAIEVHYQKVTWWRRPFGPLLGTLLWPLTAYVLLAYPYTMKSGGLLGTYQSNSDEPVDMATFDVVAFSGRRVLALQILAVIVWLGGLLLFTLLAAT